MRRLLGLVGCVAALALPPAAFGAVRCVPASGPGCTSAHATIGAAVTAAAADDEIRIAAGTYPEQIVTTKRLNFVGAGSGTLDSAVGATVVFSGSGAAIALQRGGSLRSLRAVGSTGPSGGSAVVLQPDVDGTYSYAVTDVVGIGGNATDPGIMGIPGQGLHAVSLGAGRIISLAVTGGAFRGGTAAIFSSYGANLSGPGLTGSLTGTTVGGLHEIATGLGVTTGATVEATGVTAQAPNAAFVSDSTVNFHRSRLEGRTQGLVVNETSGAPGTAVSVTDSLVSAESLPPVDAVALSAQTLGAGSPLTVRVDGSTIVAGGEDPLYAVVAQPASGAPATTIELRNSIARLIGPAEVGDADVVADRGTVTAANSAFATRRELNGGSVTAPGSGTNLTADPLFTPGAFTLQAGSPLIDRGDPGIVAVGQLDLAGNPRSIGAAPDIGAFEAQPSVAPPPPPPPNVAPGLTKVSMTNSVFAPVTVTAQASRRRRPVKRGTTFRYQLSEAATVTIAIERRVRGRRVGKRCVKPTKRNAGKRSCKRWVRVGSLRSTEQSGRQSTAFSGRFGKRALAPGRYRARLTAKDALGARSSERRLAFRVVRAR